MHFRTPIYLALLALLPLIYMLGRPGRGAGRRRSIISLVVRITMMTSLVLALAGLELHRPVDRLSVVFLLDASDSYLVEQRDQSYEEILQTVKTMPAGDRAGLIVFGEEALVDQPVSEERDWGPVTTVLQTRETDLESAIRLAQAVFPPETARRIVLFSDGNETRGTGIVAARQAQAAGIDLIWNPIPATGKPEVSLLEVQTPAQLIQGEAFNLEFTLQASAGTSAIVRVIANGEVVSEQPIDIRAGERSYHLALSAGPAGFARYEVQIEPEIDTAIQNNALAAFSEIEGPPAILIVAPPPGEPLPFQGTVRGDEYSELSRALDAAGFQVDIVHPSGLPSSLENLAGYGAVILVDVPAGDLNSLQLETLRLFVRDLGGGLVAVGGPTSFGVGGYYRTPLEELLPVEMVIKNQSRKPPVSLLFILDRSGSMAAVSGGASKLALAKEAVIRSIQLMFPGDQVGVIVFNDAASWVAPLLPLQDPAAVIRAVESIQSGGGTDILSGIEAAGASLTQSDSPVKHMILLTDGGADPAGIPELVAELQIDYNITLSTVGVGLDAAPFLPTLAELGGGRYHAAPDPAAIPSIFTQETTLVSRAYLVEGDIQPEPVLASPILGNIDSLPSLRGYVATSPKIAASLVIRSPLGDPILATWQYGLGKTVAFTSDSTNRWAQDWIGWEGYAPFWSQLVRFVTSVDPGLPFDARIDRVDGLARIQLDTINANIEPMNNYQVTANIIGPDRQTETIPLGQVAPGLYEAFFDPVEQGAYLISLSGSGSPDKPGSFTETLGWVEGYGQEYQPVQRGEFSSGERLDQAGIFRRTGSREAFFRHDLPKPVQIEPVWEILLGIAAALLPLDIAIRRLTVNRSDLAQGWSRLTEGLTRFRGSRKATEARPPGIQALFGARQRARDKSHSNFQVELLPTKQVDGGLLDERQRAAKGTPEPALQAESSDPAGERLDEESLAAALLARRKRQNRKN